MTGAVAIVLPSVIFVGTMFGSVLRKWSRNAQEQVATATGVADEAIGNIRTVRAFSMEESENRYCSLPLRRWLTSAKVVYLRSMWLTSAKVAYVSQSGLPEVKVTYLYQGSLPLPR